MRAWASTGSRPYCAHTLCMSCTLDLNMLSACLIMLTSMASADAGMAGRMQSRSDAVGKGWLRG